MEIRVTRFSGSYLKLLKDVDRYHITDEYGEIRHGVFAVVGSNRKDGESIPRALIVVKEDGNENVITHYQKNIRSFDPLREMLRYAISYSKIMGAKRLRITKEACNSRDQKDVLEDLGFFNTSVKVEFLVDTAGSIIKDKLTREILSNIKPFYKVPASVILSFEKKHRKKIEPYQDYRNVEDVSPKLCVAYVPDGEMTGYILCKKEDLQIHILAVYAENGDPAILKGMMIGLRELKRTFYPNLDMAKINVNTTEMEKFIKALYKKRIMSEERMYEHIKEL